MTNHFQIIKNRINSFPASIIAELKVAPTDVPVVLLPRLAAQKRGWTEVVASGQHFVIDTRTMSMLYNLGLEYWANKSQQDDQPLILPFPEIVLDCPYPSGDGARFYFVRQRAEFIDIAPMAVKNDHWTAPCSIRAWNTETDEEATFFTVVNDLRAIKERRELLKIYETQDDNASAFAMKVIMGLCLHLDNPRYVRAERQQGTYSRQQRRLAERKDQPLPAVSTIRIKLTEEGVRKHQAMQRTETSNGTVRHPPRRHHVRAHTVRRRNGTTYMRRAFVRGHGDLIEQTRIVEVEDDAEE